MEKSYKPSMDELLRLGIKGDEKQMIFFEPKGCEQCDHIGYKGVTGIFECIVVNNYIKEMIANGETPEKIKAESRRHGMVTMLENAVSKILNGEITSKDTLRLLSF